jgi:hypothetical protein
MTTIPITNGLPKILKLEDTTFTFTLPISSTYPLEPNPKLIEFSLKNTLMVYRQATYDQLKKKEPYSNGYGKLIFLDQKRSKPIDFGQLELSGKIKIVHNIVKQ